VGGVGVGFLGWLTCVCDPASAVALMSRRGTLSIISPLRLWTAASRDFFERSNVYLPGC